MDTKVTGRKRKSVEKPLCKYGSSCYQKNPEHRKKFKHSSIKDNKTITNYFNVNSLSDAPKTDIPKKPERESPEIENISDESPELDKSDTDDNVRIEETVDEILKSMPKDFFDFWKFCSSVNKSKPQDSFSEVGYRLVGTYDLLTKKLPKDKKVDLSCHWRYFYDPPEFQTIIKKDGKDLYHIGYFRDDPSEMPSILASNSAAVDSKLTLMGDNIFCAVNEALTKTIKSSQSKALKVKATELQKKLQKYAFEKKYSIDVQTNKTKKRQKSVVAKTFHGLGIVVPVKNDVGYRPLPDSTTVLKTILKKIVAAENESKRLDLEEPLDEIVTNVHIANDECDYGMGLELGIDLFCYGEPCLHKYVLSLLPLAYNLLNRSKYATVIEAHLKDRKKGDKLNSLGV